MERQLRKAGRSVRQRAAPRRSDRQYNTASSCEAPKAAVKQGGSMRRTWPQRGAGQRKTRVATRHTGGRGWCGRLATGCPVWHGADATEPQQTRGRPAGPVAKPHRVATTLAPGCLEAHGHRNSKRVAFQRAAGSAGVAAWLPAWTCPHCSRHVTWEDAHVPAEAGAGCPTCGHPDETAAAPPARAPHVKLTAVDALGDHRVSCPRSALLARRATRQRALCPRRTGGRGPVTWNSPVPGHSASWCWQSRSAGGGTVMRSPCSGVSLACMCSGRRRRCASRHARRFLLFGAGGR